MIVLKLLACFSLLPLALLQYVFQIIPMLLLGQLRYIGVREGVPVFDAKGKFESWMIKSNWNGFAGALCIILADDPMDVPKYSRTLQHEGRHARQMLKYGALQPILYFYYSIKIFFFDKEKHSYYDNPFEREAREAAGQMVDIPKEYWGKGPKDRWIWW